MKQPLELPHDREAERALLGAMIGQGYFDPDVLLACEDFFSPAHQEIYHATAALADAGESTNLVTLVGALRKQGILEKVGGASYVASLLDGVPVGVSLKSWEKSIRECALRRRLMQATDHLRQLAPSEDFESLEHRVDGLRELLEGRREETVPDGSLERIEAEYENYCQRLDEFSIRTGIHELDERTGGFQLGEVVTLIARTGVGKSAIAQNIMQHVLESYPQSGVVYFSLEMPRLQAFERQLQIYEGKQRGDVILAYKTGNKNLLGRADFVQRFDDRLAIFDHAGLSLPEIEGRVRALISLKRIQPVKFLVIDYLGYLGGGPKNAELVERVSELARGVKQLAKRLHCVVFLLAQTSRKAGDGSEEVTVTDARDSGAIEDSADFLIGCWRPELKSGISPMEYGQLRGQLWFRLLKTRRGMQDKFRVTFEGKTLRVLEHEAVTVP